MESQWTGGWRVVTSRVFLTWVEANEKENMDESDEARKTERKCKSCT